MEFMGMDARVFKCYRNHASCVSTQYLWLAVNALKSASRGYSRHFQSLRKARISLAPPSEQERIVAESWITAVAG